MKNQKVRSQMKGQDETPEKQLMEVEIGNLPEKEFRVMIVKMIQDLRETMEKTHSFSLFIHSFIHLVYVFQFLHLSFFF